MTGGLRSTTPKSTPHAPAQADGLLEGLLGAIPDGVVVFDREARCTYIDAAMRARWGWHADIDLAGRPMEDVFAGCADGEPCRTLRAAIASRRPVQYEAYVEPLKIWVSDTAHPTRDGGLVVISRDITAQRHADERVRASQEQLRRAAETFFQLVSESPFGVYVIDADFKVAVASKGTDNAFQSVQPVVGRDFSEVMRTLWPEPSATQFVGLFRRTLETGEPYRQPRLVEHREDTGEQESYDWQITRVTMHDGRYGVVCHFYDLSERITFEAQLSEGRQRLQTALEASDQGVWELELATGRFACDERGRAIHGFGPGDVVDTIERARSHNHPDDRAVFDPKLEEARTTGRFEAEYRVIMPPGHPSAGEVRWVATVARVSPDRARLMGVCQDVTARVVPQQALRLSEARYRALTSAISDVAYRMSADWSVMQPLDGRNLVKSNDRPIRDWLTRNIPPDEHERIHTAIAGAIGRKGLFELEHRVIRPDGSIGWTLSRAVPILDEAGNILEWFGVASDITDKVRAGETLRDQGEQLRLMAEANPIGILQGTASGKVLYCNQAYCAMTGYTLEDFQSGRVGWDTITPPEWLPLDRQKVAEAKRDGRCTPYEKEYVRKDGTRVPVLVGFALYGEDRELSSAWIVDRTEVKRAEQALAEQRRLYQSVTDNATTALFIMDEHQQCVFMNPAAEQLTGYSLGETLGRPLHDVVHHTRPDGTPYPLSECPIDQAFPKNDREQGEETFVHKDGHFYPVAFTASPLRDQRGAPIGTVIEVRDISRERHFEQSLRSRAAEVQRQLNELTSLYKAAPAGLCTLDRDFRYVRVNDALAAINGLPAESHLGLTPHDVIPDIAPAAEPTFRAVLATGQPIQFELSGSTAVVEDGVWDEQWYPVRDENGAVTHVGVVVTDITARKRAERALRDNEQQLRMAQDAARAGLWSFDPVSGTVYWDARTREIFGVGPDETVTFDSAFTLFHPDDRKRILAAYEASIDPTGPGRYDVEHRTVRPATGEARWVASTGRAEFAGEGPARHAVRLAGLVTEVTDRKQIEAEREQLLSAEQAARAEVERMARIKDEFLATLSHELRTPLNAIVGWVQILRRLRTPDERLIREGVEAIARNADAQAHLINDLLDMNRIVSGKLKMEVGPVDPNLVASAAAETVRPAADSKGVRLEARLAGGLPQVTGDHRRLTQALWNLLTNAVKFTPPGGRVTLSTTATDRGVRFEVEDTGQGLDPAFLPRLFDRFSQADASAARKHGGLGLGLSIVKQLVELHGGAVSAQSDGPGRGARFCIDLPARMTGFAVAAIVDPARQADDVAASVPAETAQVDLRGVSILLVDDQPDSLEPARRLLAECGAIVVTAASAQAALDHLRHQRPHVLLSDIGMPEMDGYRLIREVREGLGLGANDLPAAAMTAFTRDEDRYRAIAAGYQVHLPKPLRPQVLVPAVAALARARSGSGGSEPLTSANVDGTTASPTENRVN